MNKIFKYLIEELNDKSKEIPRIREQRDKERNYQEIERFRVSIQEDHI